MNLLVLVGCSGSPSSPEPSAPVPEVPAPAPAPVPAPVPGASPGHGGRAVGTVPPGAIGVVLVAGSDLLVIFPASELAGFDPKAVPPEDATWLVAGDLTVFGANGVQAQMPPPNLSVIRWCQDQHRLEGRVVVPAPPPPEVMVAPDKNVLSFVRVGEAGPVPAPKVAGALGAGDLDKDGQPDVYLTEKFELVTAKGTSPLKCAP
jgi:hypothetical protein